MKNIKKDKKKIIPILVILIFAIVLAVYLMGKNDLKFKGVIEATVVSHIAEVSGKIIEMPVELGAHVIKGDTLAIIDSTNEEYALEQLEITLEKKKLALADIQVGVESNWNSQAKNSISIAEANYNSAQAAYNKASSDYQNALSLYKDGAVPKDALDNAKLKADSTSYAVSSAKAQLDSAGSQTSVESMRLDIAQIESQIQQTKETLEKFTIKATRDGVVMSKSYILGDMVASGYDLVDIAADDEKYFVFYLPKEKLNSMEYNQEMIITSNYKEYNGIVKFIDVKSQYTPKDMQTAANKNKDSVKIKLLLPTDSSLKPGQEAGLIF